MEVCSVFKWKLRFSKIKKSISQLLQLHFKSAAATRGQWQLLDNMELKGILPKSKIPVSEKSSHTEPPYLGCYPRYQMQKGPHHKRCLLNYLRHHDDIYCRIGPASFGVTDPQDYHSLAPSLHYVVDSCELHIEVPLVQKYAKSECAHSSGNSQKQPTEGMGGAMEEDLRKVVVGKKNLDSSGQKAHLFGAHFFCLHWT